jgi:putative hydrolase of the HAD superfamily
MKRAVLLDALGTLVALPDPSPALADELGRRHGIEISRDEARAALRAEMAFYRVNHDIASDADGLARLRERCAEVLLEALPPAAAGLGAGDALAVLLAALRFAPYPEVPAVLEELRGRGVALVVVSNWDISLRDVLRETGLAPLLDGVFTSAEVGSAKPDPEIFRRALDLAGVDPADALHVGDSPEADVAGARAAGVEPVLVVRDPASRPPVPELGPGMSADELEGVTTVASLAELPALAT